MSAFEQNDTPFPDTLDPEDPNVGLPTDLIGDEVEDEQTAAPDPTAELRAELERERQERREAENYYRAQMQTFLERAAPQPAVTGTPEVDLSNLPDPVEKPQEYTRALLERVNQSVEQRFQQTTTETQALQQQQQVLDTLWSKMREKHSDIVTKDALITVAAQGEIADLRARGVDPMLYMRTNPDAYVDKVAARVKAELNIPAATASGNRTRGVGGGSTATAPAATGKKAESYIDQMRRQQAKMGIL